MRSDTMHEATRLVTAEELERMSNFRGELVEGRLVEMSPVNLDHGQLVLQLGSLLQRHVKRSGLGVVGTEVGFKLASNPDTVRAPDIAFIRQDRLATARRRGFVHDVPDLAIEVLSPDDRPGYMRKKIAEYLTKGVSLVVIVDPKKTTVEIHRRGAPVNVLTDLDEVLDLNDVITDFRCTLRQIFE
jgi:Uma2 family endonuclease